MADIAIDLVHQMHYHPKHGHPPSRPKLENIRLWS